MRQIPRSDKGCWLMIMQDWRSLEVPWNMLQLDLTKRIILEFTLKSDQILSPSLFFCGIGNVNTYMDYVLFGNHLISTSLVFGGCVRCCWKFRIFFSGFEFISYFLSDCTICFIKHRICLIQLFRNLFRSC
jgi:hypothetical protein